MFVPSRCLFVALDEKGYNEGVGSKGIDVISVLNKLMASLKAASKLFVCFFLCPTVC